MANGQAPSMQLMSAINITPNPVPSGSYVTITCSVKNTGATSGTFDFETDLLDASGGYLTVIKKLCSQTIAAGATASLTFQPSSPGGYINYATGSYKIQLVALYSSCNGCGASSCPRTYPSGFTNPISLTIASPYCGGTTNLISSSGSFNDGSGSNTYCNNETCSWLIQPTGATSITLSFSSFATESGFDFVKVYNGTSSAFPLLGSFSGASIPSAVTSGSNMFVQFTSDNATVAQGWTAGFTSTASCSAPTSQATSINFSGVSSNQMTVNWTSGNGTNRIVVAKASSSITGTPSNGSTYTANSSFGNGSTLNAGEYVIYNGTGSGVTVTNLSASTTYYFRVFESKCSPTLYLTTAASGNPNSQATSASCSAPTSQATSINFSGISTNQMIVNWTSGNGTSRIVVAKAGNAISGTPSNGSTYTSSSSFGNGSTLNSGEYIIYNGTGSSVTVTNLSASTTYYFRVFESKCNPTLYLTTTASGNPNNQATQTAIPPSWIGFYYSDLNHQYLGSSFLLDSANILQSFPNAIKICGDGSKVTVVKYANHNLSIPNSNIKFRISSDPFGFDINLSGYFNSIDYSYNGDTIIARFTHPKYVIPTWFDLFRDDYIEVFNTGNSIVIYQYPIKIFRAPIVFVHGLWGNGGTFEDMRSAWSLSCPLMFKIDYSWTNASSFYTNRNYLRYGIDAVLTQARNNKYSAGKAIVIAHSMGGILSRLYLQNTGFALPYKNDIIKLVTLNTPHYGTQVANWLWNGHQTLISLLNNTMGITNNGDNTAILNMEVNSYETLYQLDISTSLQNKVASSTITTDATGAGGLASVVRAILPSTSNLYSNDVNDLIVPHTSQDCNLNIFNPLTGQWHVGSPSNSAIINGCKVLLDENPASSIYFTNSGFPRAVLPPPALAPSIQSQTLQGLSLSSSTVDSVKILNPLPGQIFNAGDSVSVNLFSSGNVSRISLIVYGNSVNSMSIDTTQVTNLRFQIPLTATGVLNLWVLAGDSTNWQAYDTTHIVINSVVAPDSIVADPINIHLPIGLTNLIDVYGYFGGNVINLTGNMGLSITYDNTYLNYQNNGYFQGRIAGLTDVIFNYNGLSDTVHFDIYDDPSILTASFNYSSNRSCSNSSIQFTDVSLGIPASYEWAFQGGIPPTSNQPNPLVTYSLPGVYSVKLKTNFTNGVDSIIVDSLITIYPLPIATIIPNGATTFCSGNNVNLSSSIAGINYLWSNNETTQSISISTTGNYSIEVTDGNGCIGTSTMTSVTVNSLPTVDAGDTVTIIQGNSTVIGGIPTAIGNTPFTYSWTSAADLDSSNAANPTASPQNTTTYTVVVTDVNGCSSIDSILVIVNLPTGIIESANGNGLLVFPNPAKDLLNIIGIKIGNGEYSFELKNVFGQAMFADRLKVANHTMQKQFAISELSNGMYFLIIENGKSRTVTKVQKQN